MIGEIIPESCIHLCEEPVYEPLKAASSNPSATDPAADLLVPATGYIRESLARRDSRSRRRTPAPKSAAPRSSGTDPPTRGRCGSRASPCDSRPPRHRVLRGNRHQHVDIVHQQMPVLYPTLSMQGPLPQHLAQLLTQSPVDRLLAVLREKHHVILTVPFRMIKTSVRSHEDSLPWCLSGSRGEFLTRLPDTSNAGGRPGKAGGLPRQLESEQVRHRTCGSTATAWRFNNDSRRGCLRS